VCLWFVLALAMCIGVGGMGGGVDGGGVVVRLWYAYFIVVFLMPT